MTDQCTKPSAVARYWASTYDTPVLHELLVSGQLEPDRAEAALRELQKRRAEPAASQRATEAALLDCPPSRPQGMARHAELAPRVRAAIALAITNTRLSGGRSLVETLNCAGSTTAVNDVVSLIDAISRAVGEVLTAEDP